MLEIKYTGKYRNIYTEEQLPNEGVLTGEYGSLNFQRCSDGFSIYNSYFKGSGFVSWASSMEIGFPETINDIPVTEIHQDIIVSDDCPVTIEGGRLKRVYLCIVEKENLSKKLESNLENPLDLFVYSILKEQEKKEREEAKEIWIEFCNSQGRKVDFCEIECKQKCILKEIDALNLKINSPLVVLKGKVYDLIESIIFSGQVYPYVYDGWDGEIPNIEYFQGAKNLKIVDGSLKGKWGWSFRGCESLESVHLSNGIEKIPAYAFDGCFSVQDLYIPDSVTEIGEYAFLNCTSLSTIHLPNCIKEIKRGLFKNCSALKKCYLTDCIEIIDDEAFKGCVSLRKPWIPKGIKK